MKQTWENDKKLSFGPNFGPFGPNSGQQFFFSKNLASSVTSYHGKLPSCTILEKSNNPILRKLIDRQMTKVISWDAVRLTSSIQSYYFHYTVSLSKISFVVH